jgi:carnosine N-methyltransferase
MLVIHRALKPGGKWINLGPLLYHWASTADADRPDDDRYRKSVELTWDELEHVIRSVGFTFTREHVAGPISGDSPASTCSYAASKRFMMWNVYRPLFFSCSK